MATLTVVFTITPDAKAQEVLTVVCEELGWTPANPTPKLQFFQEEMREFARRLYVQRKRRESDTITAQALRDDLNSFSWT